MKSFNAIMGRLKTAMSKMGPGMIPALPTKPKHRTNEPNLFRRMCKPLYGGMAHRMHPIGQHWALTQDQVRAIETILDVRIKTAWNEVSVKGTGVVIGGKGDNVYTICENFMNAHGIKAILVSSEDTKFRKMMCKVYGVPVEEIPTFEEWLEINDCAISEDYYNNNMHQEGVCFEAYAERLYEEAYLTTGS